MSVSASKLTGDVQLYYFQPMVGLTGAAQVMDEEDTAVDVYEEA